MTSYRRFTRPRTAYAAPAWAGEQQVGGPGPKAVLLVLSNYADENYSCFPGQETIARETEQSVRTVRRQLEMIEGLGLIRREKRYDAAGKRTSDRYFLDLDLVVDVNAPDDTSRNDATLDGSLPANLSSSDSGANAATTGRQVAASSTGQPEPTTGQIEQVLPDTCVRVTPREPTPSSKTPSNPSSSVIADAIPDAEKSDDDPTGTKNDRADVDAVCKHLQQRIVDNGCKKPTITVRWRDAARLMLDLDGRSERQIHNMIEWATRDEFWRANILSMPTLREKYDQMRLRAAQEKEAAEQAAAPRRGQIDWSAAMAKAEALDAARAQQGVNA